MRITASRISTIVLVVVTAVVATGLAPEVGAQVYYTYPGAPPVKPDQPALGADVGFGDELFRVLGHGRFNVNSDSDLGLELLFDNADTPADTDVWRWGFAVDYKYAIMEWDSTDNVPFDLAVNAGFGYQNGGDMWNLRFPVGGIVSRPIPIRDDNAFVPYGGVYVLFDYANWELPLGVPGDSDFEVDVELRIGAGYELKETALAYATLHLGAGTRFYLGINFLL